MIKIFGDLLNGSASNQLFILHDAWFGREEVRLQRGQTAITSVPLPAPWQGLLVTVNGNPVDYHTIHPSLPIENGPAKTDLYTTPQYRWEPSEESSGNAPVLGLYCSEQTP